jgi:hypothetical protein
MKSRKHGEHAKQIKFRAEQPSLSPYEREQQLVEIAGCRLQEARAAPLVPAGAVMARASPPPPSHTVSRHSATNCLID